MKVVTDYQVAKTLATRFEPIFYSHFNVDICEQRGGDRREEHLIGRRYRGLFDDNDGSYVVMTTAGDGGSLIDRDSYGAIPLFYSSTRPIVSTDMRLIIDVDQPDFSFPALAEYLSAAYLTGGKTIYANVRTLMPNETIAWDGATLKTKAKEIFPCIEKRSEEEAAQQLEAALDNSIGDLLARYAGKVLLNLSGGTDSTLLLAKMRHGDPKKEIITRAYFHDDWRDDLDDWKYAEQAARSFGSQHQLVNVDKVAFFHQHRKLLDRAQSLFHTYAAAFYALNQATNGLCNDVPIINGSGPDESIIGTEKIAISDLVSLRSLQRDQWTDYLLAEIDYIKIPERIAAKMLCGGGEGFVETRRKIAAGLLDAPDFVEFQRRYHALTILQDHILELSAVAGVLDRTIVFPYLTNDIFRIIFSTSFDVLNAHGIYKSILKGILEKIMPKDFVHRKKIGFQSPSRAYFRGDTEFQRELSRLLSKGSSALLDLERVEPGIQERLAGDFNLHTRYDFLEWTAYSILLLEELRASHA